MSTWLQLVAVRQRPDDAAECGMSPHVVAREGKRRTEKGRERGGQRAAEAKQQPDSIAAALQFSAPRQWQTRLQPQQLTPLPPQTPIPPCWQNIIYQIKVKPTTAVATEPGECVKCSAARKETVP